MSASSAAAPQASVVESSAGERARQRRWHRQLLRDPKGIIGLIIVLAVVITGVFAPTLAPHNPRQQHYEAMLAPPAWMEGGDARFFLGTDNLGRDLLSQIIHGARVSLFVGFFTVVLAGSIGLVVGLLAGYYGGWVDNVFMRIVDAFLAVPSILISLVILRIAGPGLITVTLVLGIMNWVTYARVVRSEVLSLKQREFVQAARSLGASDFLIILRHLTPNVFPTFSVIATLRIAGAIIAESSLSFLGLGIQPPAISWGGMLSVGREYLATHWALATFPGIAITLTTLGVIFLGDALRDIFDPKAEDVD